MSDLANYLTSELENQAKKVEKLFHEECIKWKLGGFKCKLIILGEAPLTVRQFFYNKKTGGYFSFLKQHYENARDYKDEEFKFFLRKAGILNLDIYKYPLPTNFYDNDKECVLFDESNFLGKISTLKSMGLIDTNTVFVYRYKKLLDRKLHLKKPFLELDREFKHITTAAIAIGENAANINPALIDYLPITP